MFLLAFLLILLGVIGAANTFFVNEELYLLSLVAIILGVILLISKLISYLKR